MLILLTFINDVKITCSYLDIKEAHFQRSILNEFPSKFRSLDDEKNGMVTKPNMQEHVFLRVKRRKEDYKYADR